NRRGKGRTRPRREADRRAQKRRESPSSATVVQSMTPARVRSHRGLIAMVRVGLLSLVVVGLGSIGCGGGSGSTGTGGSGAGATGVTGTGGTGEVGGGGATGGTTAGTGGTGPLLPPGAFTLVTPLEGSSAQPLTPDLQWNAADGA